MLIQTVGEMRKFLEDIPDDVEICIPLAYCDGCVNASFYYDEEDGSISIIEE